MRTATASRTARTSARARPAGAKVNDVGCEIGEIVLRGVVFDTGKDLITPQSALILDSVAAGAAGQPGTKVEIRGHTDDVGGEVLNMDLSRRRADEFCQTARVRLI